MDKKKRKTRKLGVFWRNFWELFNNFSSSIRKGFVLIVIVELMSVLDPFLFKIVIDKLTAFDRGAIWWVIGAILLLFVFRRFSGLITYFKDKLFFQIISKAEKEFLVNAQKKMVSLSLSYHEREDTGNKIIKIDKGVQKILQLFESLYWEVVPVLIKLTIVCGILFWTDYRLGVSFVISGFKSYPLGFAITKSTFIFCIACIKLFATACGNALL